MQVGNQMSDVTLINIEITHKQSRNSMFTEYALIRMLYPT